jgi:hypothetical protein
MKKMMKRNQTHPVGSLVGMCGVLLMMLASHAGMAQQAAAASNVTLPAVSQTSPAAAPAVLRPVAEEEESPAAKKSNLGGIKVHGHWKMVVRNPDGTLAKQVEFENSLVTPNGGDLLLAALLTGQAVPADWAINLYANAPICSTTSTYASCVLVQNMNGLTASSSCNIFHEPCVPGLTVTIIGVTGGTITGPVGFQLAGTLTVTNATTINSVATIVDFCQSVIPSATAAPVTVTTSPTACVASGFYTPPAGATINSSSAFTSTNPTPLALTAGQILTVVVSLSFS